MTHVGLGLSYWLPETHFGVDAVRSRRIRRTAAGNFLADAVEISVSTRVVADTTSRQALHVRSGLWDKLSLTTALDDQGFLTSINSQSTRDFTPVISFVGKAVPLAVASVVTVLESPMTMSLEDQWAQTNANLARHHHALQVQVGSLLDQITRPQPPSAIVEIGKALEALESQLASISETRRSWVAAQAQEVGSGSLDLTPMELVAVPGSELPRELARPAVPPSMRELVEDYGALVALCDPLRPAEQVQQHSDSLGDRLVLRRSRPAKVGTYLGNGSGTWTLQTEQVLEIDIVDRWSHTDYLSLQGSWLSPQNFALASHAEPAQKAIGLPAEVHDVSVNGSAMAALQNSNGNGTKAIPAQANGTIGKRAARTRHDATEVGSEYEALATTRQAAH